LQYYPVDAKDSLQTKGDSGNTLPTKETEMELLQKLEAHLGKDVAKKLLDSRKESQAKKAMEFKAHRGTL
jgi:hypothetical protein